MAPSLSGIDRLRLIWHFALPLILGGFVAPSRHFWPGLVRRQKPAATRRFVQGLRKKYGPRVWVRLPVRTLLVLDGDGIEEVLEATTTAADPFLKWLPLTRFTPSGLLVSRRPAWKTRRDFNTKVLATGHACHPDAASFLAIIDAAVTRLLAKQPRSLAWTDMSDFAAEVSQEIIFGREQFDPNFNKHLTRLVAASNFGIRRRSDFVRFRGRIQEALTRGVHPSLVGGAAKCMADTPDHDGIEAFSQAAFWCFVLKDIIELHTTRTLALIVNAPQATRERVLKEVRESKGTLTAGAIEHMPFLEACIREQLRLWTPVPILARSAVEPFTLDDGTSVKRRQLLLLCTGFYHRDPEVFGSRADRFSPEPHQTSAGAPPPPVYTFSRHHQSCAGESLAVFVLKAVLTAILSRGTLEPLGHEINTEAVPVAIDHFALRFAWHPNGGRLAAES